MGMVPGLVVTQMEVNKGKCMMSLKHLLSSWRGSRGAVLHWEAHIAQCVRSVTIWVSSRT